MILSDFIGPWKQLTNHPSACSVHGLSFIQLSKQASPPNLKISCFPNYYRQGILESSLQILGVCTKVWKSAFPVDIQARITPLTFNHLVFVGGGGRYFLKPIKHWLSAYSQRGGEYSLKQPSYS